LLIQLLSVHLIYNNNNLNLIKMANQDYKDLQLGFDRTQLYKEFTQPQINRSTALQAVMSFCRTNQLKMTNVEVMALCNKYVKFIENGDTSWAKTVDKYLEDKFQDTDGVLID
jgi:hypothetical protein